MRRCPRCTFALAPHKRGTSEVDVCARCAGCWLDAGEAKAMIGENAEPSTWERTSHARHLGRTRLVCPVGHGTLTGYALKAPPVDGVEVEVDICPVCMGMWLDAWEAARVSQVARAMVRAPGEVPAPAAKTGAGWYLFQLFSGMPVEEYNPVRHRPWICMALILACVGAFAIELMQGVNAQAFLNFYGTVPKDLLAGKHVWSVITHMFLHGGFAHIAANMWFLYTFGDNVEDRVGHFRFLVLYLLFGIAAMAVQVAFTLGSEAPLIGASGAISGLMGAYLMLFPRTKLYMVLFFVRFKIPVFVYLTLWMMLQAALGFIALKNGAGTGVAWWAHVGGFAAGALWGVFNRDKYGEPRGQSGPSK